MRIDNRIGIAPLFALSFAIACGDSETVLGRGGTGGSDSGSDTGGSSTGTGGRSGGTGGRATGTGGRAAGGASGSSGNGGSSGNVGADASAGASGDGGPVGDGSSAGGNAGAGGSAAGGTGGRAAGGTGGRAAGGAGGRAAGGAGGRGTGGAPVGTACERLGDCCPTVPLQARPQCTTIASGVNQPQCGVALGIFCPSADAGPPRPPEDAANACSALDRCCVTAGPQQTQCEQTVAAGNPGLCNLILGILCP